MNPVLAWLWEVLAAPGKLRTAQEALVTERLTRQQSESIVADLQAALADAGEKHRNTMTSLASCVMEKHTLQQALAGAQVATESAQGQIEGLRASQAGLQASEAMWRDRTAALQEREAGLLQKEKEQQATQKQREANLQQTITSLNEQNATLNQRYAKYLLPPYPNTLAETRDAAWMKAKVGAVVHPPVVPGSVGPPQFLDAFYRVLPASAYQPIIDHWRLYLMPPPKPEVSDCDNRAMDFAVWVHRWSGFEVQIGVADGTTPWALLPSGERAAHIFGILADPDGAVWAVDPAFKRKPQPWTPDILAGFARY